MKIERYSVLVFQRLTTLVVALCLVILGTPASNSVPVNLSTIPLPAIDRSVGNQFGLKSIGTPQLKSLGAPVKTALNEPCIALSAYRTAFFSETSPLRSSVIYSVTTDCGKTWKSDEQLEQQLIFEVESAISTDGRVMAIAWSDIGGSGFDINVIVSRDSGQNWTEPKTISDRAFSNVNLDLEISNSGSDIRITWTTRPNEVLNSFIAMVTSNDYGQTWLDNVNLPDMSSISDTVANEVYSCLSSQGTFMNIVWETYSTDGTDQQKLHSSFSLDGGNSWSSRKPISLNSMEVAFNISVSFDASCQKILVTYESAKDFTEYSSEKWAPTVVTSSNGASSWSTPVILSANEAKRDLVGFRSYTTRDGLSMWASFAQREDSGISSIKVFRSKDSGTTWAEIPYEISDPIWGGATISGTSQLVFLTWTVARWEPIRGYTYRVFMSASKDGGSTWTQSIDLTLRDLNSYAPVIHSSPNQNKLQAFWFATRGSWQDTYIVSKSFTPQNLLKFR